MKNQFDGNAIVYCEGAFGTPSGKTAHGLVRRTERYRVLAVVDSNHAGADAGMVLDGKKNLIPIYNSVTDAVSTFNGSSSHPATHLVVGLAPDGGRLPPDARKDVLLALEKGLNVDSGLHDFLSEDPEMQALAEKMGVRIRDVRKAPERRNLHFFSGKIEEVSCLKVAILGSDSAIGKRTTALILRDAMQAAGYAAQLIGTGQTAWMQGVRYGIILDSLVNDFVSGEIEHAVWQAWQEAHPQVILLEGQGSLMNPAYPGGFEILAAGRPDVVVLQHAPKRLEYDGFPGYPMHSLEKQIQAIELLSEKPVVAVTLNHEGFSREEIPDCCDNIKRDTGVPAFDVLQNGAEGLVDILKPFIR
ncbi:MAG: DUF1611 domain-containing protein [Deltaproteobacteria bacterium]|nr:DUF1611 domain-containing protein [Deltaproteobacteria bacterium]